MASLDQFESAQKKLLSMSNLKNEELLTAYKYFKQATCGDCNIPCPGIFDQKGRAKWNYWDSVRGMSKKDAMKHYIKFVDSL